MEDRPNSGGIGRRIRALSAVGVRVGRAGGTILPVWALPVRTPPAAMPCCVCVCTVVCVYALLCPVVCADALLCVYMPYSQRLVCPVPNTRGSYALFPVYRSLRRVDGLARSFEATVQHCLSLQVSILSRVAWRLAKNGIKQLY
jgi:hypothetical protein